MAPYHLTRFRATHNSYSGGPRGSIRQQLDRGVRCLELDFHDNGYDSFGDYRVGHLRAGADVALGDGNPETLLLRDWLGAIGGWSSAHPGHAPLTLTLDAKDDLTDNDTGGDLEDLDRALEAAFGSRLFTRDDYDREGGWPDTQDLRGRLICVLSGNGSTRAAYRWAFGSGPALAASAASGVVLAYRSPAGDLNCWTGTAAGGDASIAWRRKATYAFGGPGLRQPALASTDDGWVVAVHCFGPPPGSADPLLESRVGRLRDDGRIRWLGASVFARGVGPSLALRGDEVREVHTMPDGRRRQQVGGVLDRRKRRVAWRRPRPTGAEPLARQAAAVDGRQVRCGLDPGGVVVCGFEGSLRPVRFRQLAFVEEQKGDEARGIRDALFFAADAKDRAAIAAARSRGLVTRAWGFEEGDLTGPAPSFAENAPATDTPEAAWYQDYMEQGGVAV